jgi:hypothetical protein
MARKNRAMRRRAEGWTWLKVSKIHDTHPVGGLGCAGNIHSYKYRYHRPSDSLYERCIGLAWCSSCREYSGTMVYVPRDEHLIDVLADLPVPERERLARSEVRLLDYVDRLARRGAWPPS